MADANKTPGGAAWFEGPHKEALTYLMVAIFLVELMVGGVAFFYGLMHAAPETPGGPPLARFPWMGWAVAAVLAPVGLLLVIHLAGTWVARFLGREGTPSGPAPSGDEKQIPERVRRLYAIVGNAPTVVILLGILLLGATLIFVDGAFAALRRFGDALIPYIPWLAGSAAAMLAVCFVAHRWFLYRHHRLREEYAYRRDVLERTGIVLVDRGSIPLPRHDGQPPALGQVVEAQALPPATDALPGGVAAPAAAVPADDAAPTEAADGGEPGLGGGAAPPDGAPEEKAPCRGSPG